MKTNLELWQEYVEHVQSKNDEMIRDHRKMRNVEYKREKQRRRKYEMVNKKKMENYELEMRIYDGHNRFGKLFMDEPTMPRLHLYNGHTLSIGSFLLGGCLIECCYSGFMNWQEENLKIKNKND